MPAAPTPGHDHRIDALIERLTEELVDDRGETPDPAHVAEVIHAKAAALDTAPIRDFVPLLVENEALDEFRGEGLHHVLPDEPEAPLAISSDDSGGDGVPTAK